MRKASTLRVPRHYERAMSSEPWMDFNETNRGWSSSVDPDDQGVCRCPSSTPSRTGMEINGLIFLPLRFEVLGCYFVKFFGWEGEAIGFLNKGSWVLQVLGPKALGG